MSPDERENWGEIKERVRNLERTLDELKRAATRRGEYSVLWALSWFQLVVGGSVALAVTVGGGLLVAWLAHKWF